MPFHILVVLLQTIATVSMFLACKGEDTPRLLRDVITIAYEIINSCEPPALERIKQRVWFHYPCFLVPFFHMYFHTLMNLPEFHAHRKFLMSRRNYY